MLTLFATLLLAVPAEIVGGSTIDFEAASARRFGKPAQPMAEKAKLTLSPGGHVDGQFVLSEDQPCLMCLIMKGNGKYASYFEALEKEDRASRRKPVPEHKLLVEMDFPPEVALTDVADGQVLSSEKTADGTHYRCAMIADFDMGLSRIPNDYNWWRRMGFQIRTRAKAGTELGEGRVRLTWKGEAISPVETIRFAVMPRVTARAKPKRFHFGIALGGIYPNVSLPGWERWMSFCREAGLNAIEHDMRDRTLRDGQIDIMRKVGMDWVLPDPPGDAPIYNGYRIGQEAGRPASDRFQTTPEIYAKLPPNRRKAIDGGVCPSAVYERRPFFVTNTVPAMERAFSKVDGIWCNWEPFAYMSRGCFCDVCRGKFAEFAGIPLAQLKDEWPHEALAGGKHHDAFVKFSSREHGRLIKAVAAEMKRICGGEKCKVGFVPGVAWCEMASVWPTSDYAREVQPIQYAADVDWMSPWGPYAIWPTQQPYVYSKWRNLRTFVAARDVRAQVNLDYPLPKRPKLIAYPHGIQQPDWVIRPEALEMNIDSFFFNGWEALLVYHFPQGYDQRWWAALAQCAEKQARYEDVVFDGRRADGDVALELTTPFAAPNSCEGTATRGLDIKKPMIQHVAWEKDGKTVVAVFNFWEKAPAFFRLKLRGKDLGEFYCGALRTKVYEFGAGAEPRGYTDAELAAWKAKLLPAIEKAKKADAAYEEEFGEHKNILTDISSGKLVGTYSAKTGYVTFKNGSGWVTFNPGAMSILNWGLGGQVVNGANREAFGRVGFWKPFANIDGKYRVTEQSAGKGHVRYVGSLRINGGQSLELKDLVIEKEVVIYEDLKRVDVMVRFRNGSTDEQPKSFVFAPRFGMEPSFAGKGGKTTLPDGTTYVRGGNRFFWSSALAADAAAIGKVYSTTPAKIAKADGDVVVTRADGRTCRIGIEPSDAVVGYAAWDDPKDTATTLEPFLKPVALESVGGSVEYRMTLTVGD